MTKRPLALILPLCAALASACGRDGGVVTTLPVSVAQEHVLTKLQVLPGGSVLELGKGLQLTVVALDQFDSQMRESYVGQWLDNATYVSSAPKIADVYGRGGVSAVAPGTARITASLTLAGHTATASMTTTVNSPTESAVIVTAGPNGTWYPSTVYLKAGGTVTWVIPDGVKIGTMYYNVWDSTAEKMEFADGIASRVFPTPGAFSFGTGGGLMWYEQGGRVQVY